MNAARYLEEARIEELESQLSTEGYRVTRSPNGTSPPFDLVAEKPGRKIAIDVKAWASPRKSVAQIMENRSAAVKEGFSYRLNVVPPPHRTEVVVEGLEEALSSYLREHMPPELEAIPAGIEDDAPISPIPPIVSYTLEKLDLSDFDKLELRHDEIRVVGNGVLLFAQHVDHRASADGRAKPVSRFEMDLPFHFDVILDRDHRILKGNEIRVNVSHYLDYS